MSKKRVHEIAKEQGMSPKVALARMQAAGMKVGAAASSVDEEAALRALSGEPDPLPAGNSEQGPTGNGDQRPTGGREQRLAGNRDQRPGGNGDRRTAANGDRRPAGNGDRRGTSASDRPGPTASAGTGSRPRPTGGGAGGAGGARSSQPGQGGSRTDSQGAPHRSQGPAGGRGQGQGPGQPRAPRTGDGGGRPGPRGEQSDRGRPGPRGDRPGPRGEQSDRDRPGPRGEQSGRDRSSPRGDQGDGGRQSTQGEQGDGRSGGPRGDADHKRPTRDSLQGERAPGTAGGRRRVVIDSQASRRAPGGAAQQQPPRRQRRGRRRRGVYDEEAESRPSQPASASEPDVIRVNSGSTLKDVAEYLNVTPAEVLMKLMALGEKKTLTQTLPDDTIMVLAAEFGKEVEIVHTEDEEVAEPVFDDDEADLVERPPVVTIMGHVDHGKTSLLDAIRETEVAKGEAGGITQHIGAYQVHHGGKVVTFLDTPGHEAFTAMRARGAKVTDIAVIVVAADDGVKPQTQEAVDHAKEAGVPVLVAVNKIDKEGAQPDRVRTEMTALGLQPVEWGGETEFVDVSARTKEGLDNLLETILVMAEVEELRANAGAEASGTVIESKLDPGRGPVVTILIQRGTLHVSDAVVAGADWGRVRAMHDYLGSRVDAASPGQPVEVLGFNGVPEAGQIVRVVENERRARSLAGDRAVRLRTEAQARRASKKISLEDIFKAGLQELNLVLKADVAGSLEAIEDEIAKLPQDEVSVGVIRRAVGAVTESDVMLAAASDAIILAFNVRPVGDARSVAEREGVEIRNYSVIYRAIDELRLAMQGMLAPEEVEDAVGTAEVRQTFKASRVGTIAGTHVTEGKLTRGAKVRLVRDGTVIYQGEIASLKRFNDDVREVTAGFECGVVLRDFADVKVEDVLESYATRQVERELG